MSKRQSPLQALKVAQMRCRAAVTITITGKAKSGKTTIAEYLTSELAEAGFNVALLESDDSVYTPIPRAGRDGLDNRFVLVAVEDSNVGYKPAEEAAANKAPEKECNEDCGEEVPELLKLIIFHAMKKAQDQRM
jgi:hypothetical protein